MVMPETDMKAIILLSGGLDSMVSTAIARRHGLKVVLALTFNYGQRAARREIAAAKKLCELWKIKHKVIKLPWLKKITSTALVSKRSDIPNFLFRRTKNKERRTAMAVWVPNRNALFINIAAAHAESLDAKLIVTGFNKEEAATFPDNSQKFVAAINTALKFSTLKTPKVVSYTQKMTKIDMVRYAIKNKLLLNLCWSCYKGGKKPCGVCESCARFLKAYEVTIHK